MKKIQFILILFLLVFTVSYTNQDYNFVKIQVVKNEFPSSLVMAILLTSKSNQILKIPQIENLVVGYKDDVNADCYFDVVEINNLLEKEVVPSADYQYLINKKKRIINIKNGGSITYHFDICNLYRFDKSKKYNVRLIFKLSKCNSTNDISSEWININ